MYYLEACIFVAFSLSFPDLDCNMIVRKDVRVQVINEFLGVSH